MMNTLGIWSKVVIGATIALFSAAIFTKGVTHDIFLEGAVFLVSVKLILLSNENRRLSREIYKNVSDLHVCICQPETKVDL